MWSQSPIKGAQHPVFGSCLLWPRSHISAIGYCEAFVIVNITCNSFKAESMRNFGNRTKWTYAKISLFVNKWTNLCNPCSSRWLHDLFDVYLNIKISLQKDATLTMAITLCILDRFAKFFHCCRAPHSISNKNRTLSMLLHYLVRFKNQKVCTFHARKWLSHPSNTYLSNVMKISAKINTMQNNNILLFIQLDCGDINSIVIAMVRVAPFFDSGCISEI